jgi:hypothetical protein
MYQNPHHSPREMVLHGAAKRCAFLGIAVLAIFAATQMLVPSHGMAAVPLAAGARSAAPIHSEQMRSLLASDRSDSENRMFDVQYDVEQQIRLVRRSIARMRASLLLAPSKATEIELAKYGNVAESLVNAKKALNNIQAQMPQCLSLCAKAESAVAKGKPEPANHHAKMAEYTASSSEGLKAFRKAAADLKVAALEVRNPQLAGFAQYLTKEADILGKVIGVCQTSLEQMHGSKS